MALTGLKLGVEALTGRYGHDIARRMYAASLASIDQVEEIIRNEAIDCGFRRCGHLEVAFEILPYRVYWNGSHHARISKLQEWVRH
jgi:hypothetical protein